MLAGAPQLESSGFHRLAAEPRTVGPRRAEQPADGSLAHATMARGMGDGSARYPPSELPIYGRWPPAFLYMARTPATALERVASHPRGSCRALRTRVFAADALVGERLRQVALLVKEFRSCLADIAGDATGSQLLNPGGKLSIQNLIRRRQFTQEIERYRQSVFT